MEYMDSKSGRVFNPTMLYASSSMFHTEIFKNFNNFNFEILLRAGRFYCVEIMYLNHIPFFFLLTIHNKILPWKSIDFVTVVNGQNI